MRIDQPPLPLDISRLAIGPPLKEGDAQDTAGHSNSRALVAYRDGDLVTRENTVKTKDVAEPARLPPPAGGPQVPDVRYMSPREMQDYSENLYAAGVISFEDYEALAFQPDLHPDFERTIGALTGESPAPDRKRDYIEQWGKRLDFTQRYYAADSNEVRQAHRIHEALKAFPSRTDIFA